MLFGILSRQSLLLYHLILLFSLTLWMRLLINQADHLAMLLTGCRKVSWKKNVQFDNSK